MDHCCRRLQWHDTAWLHLSPKPRQIPSSSSTKGALGQAKPPQQRPEARGSGKIKSNQ